MDRELEYFHALVRNGFADLGEWPVDLSPAQLGLPVDGDTVRLPHDINLLSAERIVDALAPAARSWLRRIEVFPAIGSTNTELMKPDVDGHGVVFLSECQTGGRGRRGRSWSSPFGRNIAMSLGFGMERGPAEFGGLSLVVGLGVHAALERCGVRGAGLKWPNDVQVAGRKLCGILVELQSAGARTIAVVGIGINVALPDGVAAAIDQQVTDVRSAGGTGDRNQIAAAVISAVYEIVARFDAAGFAPLRSAWDAVDVLNGVDVDVIGPSGVIRTGTVTGVDTDGALLIDTGGVVSPVVAGEVSVRSSAPG